MSSCKFWSFLHKASSNTLLRTHPFSVGCTFECQNFLVCFCQSFHFIPYSIYSRRKNRYFQFLGILHALAWANILWAHLRPSACLSHFFPRRQTASTTRVHCFTTVETYESYYYCYFHYYYHCCSYCCYFCCHWHSLACLHCFEHPFASNISGQIIQS